MIERLLMKRWVVRSIHCAVSHSSKYSMTMVCAILSVQDGAYKRIHAANRKEKLL